MSATEAKRRELVNAELKALPLYHHSMPLGEIDAILVKHGCWYKMETTGNYEIVAYV